MSVLKRGFVPIQTHEGSPGILRRRFSHCVAVAAAYLGAGPRPSHHLSFGDPLSYRKRSGPFIVLEWTIQIFLPSLIILLGGHATHRP